MADNTFAMADESIPADVMEWYLSTLGAVEPFIVYSPDWRSDLALVLTCETGEALTAGEITWAEYVIAKDAIAGLAGE